MKRLLPLLFALLAVACHQPPVIDATQPQGADIKENLINANRVIGQAEDTQIRSYAARRGWQPQQCSNGAYLERTRPGSGPLLEDDDTVALAYRVEALNGSVLYDGVRDTVVLGQHQPTVGVDAALHGQQRGSTLRLLLPSSLAYGVVGDGDKVPARTVLVYHISIL